MQEQNTQPESSLVQDGNITVAEACAFTRLSRSELYSLMSRGELSFVKIGRRRLLPRRAVLALMRRHLVVARHEPGAGGQSPTPEGAVFAPNSRVWQIVTAGDASRPPVTSRSEPDEADPTGHRPALGQPEGSGGVRRR